jgi:hypothetical protein
MIEETYHHLFVNMKFIPSLSSWSAAFLVLAVHERDMSVDALSAPSPPSRILLRVCTSPGCRDDGAASTLDRLLAVAPPGVDVVAGGCVSLCGSGPVLEILVVDVEGGGVGGCVVAASSASKKRKRVKGGEAITSLLDECVATTTVEGAEVGSALKPYMRDRLASGYELSIEANAAYASRDYRLAADLYSDAIESGRKPAMLLQEAREAGCSVAGPDGTTTSDDAAVVVDGGYPAGLRWLVDSLKNSCRCRLLLRDVDGARRDAFAATVFSRNADPDAHECLAEVCAASRDAVGELQGLKSAVRRYDVVERDPGRADAAGRASRAAARKRELGFRIAKLERELRI